MQIPLQITFRDMTPSAAIDARIRERAADLERFYDRITRCHVVVHAPHRRHNQGTLFHVRIDMTVPGSELVVNREPAAHHAHEDVYVAIRDAFDAARRQLEDYARRTRGATKSRQMTPSGRVVKLVPEEDYGFIDTADGREIYFHRHSIVNASMDELAVGSEVEFVEASGENGPQASTVRVCGRR